MRTTATVGILSVTVSVACSAPPGEKVIVVPGWQPSSGSGTSSSSSGSSSGASSGSPAGSSSSGGSGSSGGQTSSDGGAPQATGVPCDVATMLAANCTGCHSDPPATGALVGLVTYSDLMATSKGDATKNEAQQSLVRMQDTSSPMPPGGVAAAADVTTLQNWIQAGYPQGTCGGTDAGADAATAPPPASVFTNAPPFASQTGRSTHNAGKDCMTCHAGGDAPQFAFGGTLYDGSGNPVSGAEVRLVDANGGATSVYTSTSGTFYKSGSGFAAPAHIGVRNATAEQDMHTALQSSSQPPASNGGACSACHCSGSSCTMAPIHLP